MNKTNVPQRLYLLVIITILYLNVQAQKSTYIGVETGVSNDLLIITDPNDIIERNTLINGFWGVNIRQDLNKINSIEIGLIKKYNSYGFEAEAGSLEYAYSQSFIETWQIPLRWNSRFNLYKEKLYFTTRIGISLSLVSGNVQDESGEGTKVNNGIDTFSFINTSNDLSNNAFGLFETGVGLEFLVLKKAYLTFTAGYFSGFNKVYQKDITYQINNGVVNRASAVSMGEYFQYSVGIRYPIKLQRTKTITPNF